MQSQSAPAIVIPLVLVALLGIFVAPWAAGIVLAIGLAIFVGALLLRAFARPLPGREHTERSPGTVDPQTYSSGAPASGEGTPPQMS
jgi:hypothetical protein